MYENRFNMLVNFIVRLLNVKTCDQELFTLDSRNGWINFGDV